MPKKKRVFKGTPCWAKREVITDPTARQNISQEGQEESGSHLEFFSADFQSVNSEEQDVAMKETVEEEHPVDTNIIGFINDDLIPVILPFGNNVSVEQNDFNGGPTIFSYEDQVKAKTHLPVQGPSTSTPSTSKPFRILENNSLNSSTENQVGLNDEDNMPSASRRKLLHISTEQESDSDEDFEDNVTSKEPQGYRIVSMNSLQAATCTLRSSCHKVPVKLMELKEIYGMGSVLLFECSFCKTCTYFTTSDVRRERLAEIKKTGATRPQDHFDINRRAVLASLKTGIGFSGMQTMSSVMMFPLSANRDTWVSHSKKILPIAKNYIRRTLDAAREQLRETILNCNEQVYDRNIPVEVGVSYDGTWSKRGFTANYGFGFIISVDTGKVLDYEFLSKVCPTCDKNKNASEEWKINHKPFCERNHHASSKAMEMVAASKIWRRSSAYDMNYKSMICDGDSSAYNEIWKTYGSCESCEKFMFLDNTEIEKVKMTAAYKDWVETHNNDTTDCDRVLKLDCIGHVQKRLGKYLIAWKQRNGVKPWSKSRAASATSNKVTENKRDANDVKSGKELTHGKDRNKEKAEKCTGCTRSHTLTMDAVKKLQLYYGKALRRHCISYSSSEEEKEKALEKMKRAVLAILWHSCMLINEEERHKYCPDKSDQYNWCDYKNGVPLRHSEYHLPGADLAQALK